MSELIHLNNSMNSIELSFVKHKDFLRKVLDENSRFYKNDMIRRTTRKGLGHHDPMAERQVERQNEEIQADFNDFFESNNYDLSIKVHVDTGTALVFGDERHLVHFKLKYL